MARLPFVLFNWSASKGAAFNLATVGAILIATSVLSTESSLAQSKFSREEARAISPFCETFQAQFNPFTGDVDMAALSAAIEQMIEQGDDLDQLCDMNGVLQLLPLNYLVSVDGVLARQLIDRLIEAGANVNAQDSEGNSPLHYVGSSVEMARSLLESGAQVNVSNRRGNTPLHNVFGNKTVAVIALLIEQGAEVNARDEEQITPLHFAYSSSESAQVADLLIRSGADINAQTSQGFTPLHYAIAYPAIVQRLLHAGADITLQNNREGAPIHARGITPEVLQMLIDQGADINLRNSEGQTPLHQHRSDVAITRILLENRAPVNVQDNQGKTPLFNVNIEVAKLLVAAGADLAIQDNEGETALHEAVLEEESFFGPELVSLFLQHSVDLEIKNNQGETALDIARQLDKTEIINLLEQGVAAPENLNLGGTTAAGVNIQPLQQQLVAKNWALADQETRRLLSPEGDPYGPNAATTPLDLIRAIDQAWLTASDGQFGFSVQAKLWQAASAAHPDDSDAAVNAFRDRVGWQLVAPRAENDFISSDWLNESELNYSLQAPTGHLPWAGVSDTAVQAVLAGTAEGCGSCTTDAMQLRNERFYRYLPQLFERVQVALDTPATTVQSWRSPKLLYQLNLAAIYPSGSRVRPTVHAISPDSQTLAVASRSDTRSALALWNLATGTRRITLIEVEQGMPTANAIAFSHNSQQVFAGLSNGRIQVWETAQGKSLRSWVAHSEGVKAMALSNDGKVAVSGGDTTLKVWDASTGSLLQTLQLTAGEVQPVLKSVQISPDGQRLAVATGRTIQLWNLSTGQLIKVAISTTEQNQAAYSSSLPLSMAFSPDSRLLATLDTDNTIKGWNASNGARYITFLGQQSPAQAISFSTDGQTLISRHANQSVLFWNLSTFVSDRTISLSSGSAPIPVDTANAIATQQPITLSPDGQTFAVPLTSPTFEQSRFSLDLRSVATGTRQTVLPDVHSGSFSSDNRFLVTRGEALQVWQP